MIDGATGMVRLTHNLAMIHRDAVRSPYPVRLVYGGHVVGLAQASLSRVLPGMATVAGWHGCDHTARRSRATCCRFATRCSTSAPRAEAGRSRCARGFAQRGDSDPGGRAPDGGTPVLD
ncbi:MAG: hypothetical protein R2695_08230 [Acidimicrobiales bacterium]